MPNDERESIWSVRRGARPYYFGIFGVLLVIGTALVAWQQTAQVDDDTLLATGLAIWGESSKVGIASAAGAVILTEIGSAIMIMTEKLFKIRAKAREEGREETNRRWTEWNERRMKAEEEGKVFDEPPPTLTE